MKSIALTLVFLLSLNGHALEVNPVRALKDLAKAARKAHYSYSLLPTENEPVPVTRCLIIGARTALIYSLAELPNELGLEQQFIALNKPELAKKAVHLDQTISQLMKINSELSDECYEKGVVSAETVAAYNNKAQPLHREIWRQISEMQKAVSPTL